RTACWSTIAASCMSPTARRTASGPWCDLHALGDAGLCDYVAASRRSKELQMKVLVGGGCALLVAALMSGRPIGASTSCESLTALALPRATVTLARQVEAGAFAPAAAAGEGAPPLNAPRPFCRVAATLKPTADSD